MRKRLGIISFFVLLFVGFIVVWNYSYKQGLEEAYIPMGSSNGTAYNIPSESGVFERSEYAMDYLTMPTDPQYERSLSSYYDNRAFYGAPPSIPHPVVMELDKGENVCLQCHKNGGFTPKFNAYAPITPHPEMVNCRQCHVTKNTSDTFKGYTKAKFATPEVGNSVNSALLGSPPTIPHQIQMRENCLACHAGPSAPKEIRVTHPDRVNCRQCHVPKKSSFVIKDTESLIRSFNSINNNE